VKRIWRGMWYSEKYGHHPGWESLAMLLLIGGIAGGLRGFGIVLLIFGPMFLIGCWERGDVMDYVTIDIDQITRATNKAVLAKIGENEHWIPRSVIEDGDDLDEGDFGEINVAEWFAQKEELE